MTASVAAGRAVPPDLSRMRALMDLLGHPEAASPVIHITGTNGKTSTARAVTALLAARGLTSGTFTSPHLSAVNERFSSAAPPDRSAAPPGGPVAPPGGSVGPPGGSAAPPGGSGGRRSGAAGGAAGPGGRRSEIGALISDAELTSLLESLSGFEAMLGARLTWFELVTAAAFMWFADLPVDVSVLEVGMGGRWDATNVASASVAVVTNIGLDHVEFLGPTREHVAAEKAGILRPGAPAVLGPDIGSTPSLMSIFSAEGASPIWTYGRDFGCSANAVAVGGRSLSLWTPGASYDEVFLDLHGAHQGQNFACALAAVEAFFDEPVPDQLVREAAATVSSPGRMEIASRSPLIVLDGAKNLEGAATTAAALAEEFGSTRPVILVVGILAGAAKDPTAMLSALGVGRPAGQVRLVVACDAPSPRAQPAAAIADAAARLGCEALSAPGVEEALDMARAEAEEGDLILVTGSLYVVGAARTALSLA